MADAPAVAVSGVAYSYPGGFTLRHDGFAVARGERAAVIGPSGCGKTTLLHLLAGILLPTSGSVACEGEEWSAGSDAARRRRRITRLGLVFQEFELLDHLTVRENILLPYYVNAALTLDDAARERAHALADAARIARYLDRRPRSLSHGERQRVAICRALAAAPAVVLADEPTGNLDPKTAAAIVELLRTESAQRGATLVMVTHDHGLLDAFDQVVELAEPSA